MKLLCEQRKLQRNNKELTFEEDQEPLIQRKKEEELKRQRERMRILRSRRQLNCEATPSSNVGVISSATPSSNVEVISSSHVEETLICRFDNIHIHHVMLKAQHQHIKQVIFHLLHLIVKTHHLRFKVRNTLNLILMFKMLRELKRL